MTGRRIDILANSMKWTNLLMCLFSNEGDRLTYWGNTMKGAHLLMCQHSEVGDRLIGWHINVGTFVLTGWHLTRETFKLKSVKLIHVFFRSTSRSQGVTTQDTTSLRYYIIMCPCLLLDGRDACEPIRLWHTSWVVEILLAGHLGPDWRRLDLRCCPPSPRLGARLQESGPEMLHTQPAKS